MIDPHLHLLLLCSEAIQHATEADEAAFVADLGTGRTIPTALAANAETRAARALRKASQDLEAAAARYERRAGLRLARIAANTGGEAA